MSCTSKALCLVSAVSGRIRKGLPVSCRRTFATGIVPVAALGEILASPSRLRSAFYAGSMTRAAPSRIGATVSPP